MSKFLKKDELGKALQTNSNMPLIGALKTITPETSAKDLSEAQKQAFMAMMRMVHDPRELQWTKRREKLKRQAEAKQEAAGKERSESERKKGREVKEGKKSDLKRKIADMRATGKFPLPPEKPGDRYRRYGFIPKSERRQKLADYGK